ncbi:hypothetical protein [Mahella australiensis]|uniref:Yip1 domain-containing protein n=1 Tax=Mahella australiensis (strain DSM 15567 / CIP 107919 / 50-1 BON) TaxID=697281 RepID=F3ZX67_MAHA5|nr:hypothetical protein [Mahella australiensis]AEE95516.1 hypothetical protein Mahau_0299 [Mahella australiensis 50-1 BON]
MENVKKPKVSKARLVLNMMLSPASALSSSVSKIAIWFPIAVSSSAFCLFFLQTGLDLYKTGQKELNFVYTSAIAGTAYGLIFIPIVSVLIWIFLRLGKTQKDLKWVISSICLSYSGSLLYGVAGLIFSLFFAWKTSVAFGATGVIWAAGPMIVVIRAATDGQSKLSIPIATLVCAMVLISWSIFGQI